MNKAYVFSHRLFNEKMSELGWTSPEYVPEDAAVVSIITGVYDAFPRMFDRDSSNVITLSFFDTTDPRDIEYPPISEDQAHKLTEFILANIGKTFYIHCAAGQSRSQAVARVLSEQFDYEVETLNGGNGCYPNSFVYRMLTSEISDLRRHS